MTISGSLRKHMFELVEQFRQGKTEKADFCKEHNISLRKLLYWHQKYQDQKKTAIKNVKEKKFISVSTKPEIISVVEKMMIHYPNGICVELPGGINISVVRSLIGI